MAVYAVALASSPVVEVQQATTADNPLLWFIGGRFAEPAGYSNGVAALFIGGLWPALFLGSRRETPWQVRGVLLGVAAVLLEVALMTQSRGFVIVLPFALTIYLCAVTNRLRALLFTLLVAAAVAASAPSILDVFTVAEDGGDVTGALESARGAILLTFAGLLVVGTAIAFVDRRTPVPDRVAAVSGRIAAVCIAAAALAGVIVAIGVIGNPVSWAGDRWDDFKGGYSEQGFGDTRFSGDLGSNRYDFWRVVIEDQFADVAASRRGLRQLRGDLPRGPQERGGPALSTQSSASDRGKHRPRRPAPLRGIHRCNDSCARPEQDRIGIDVPPGAGRSSRRGRGIRDVAQRGRLALVVPGDHRAGVRVARHGVPFGAGIGSGGRPPEAPVRARGSPSPQRVWRSACLRSFR